MRILQDSTRLLEPPKKSGATTPLARRARSLRCRDGSDSFGQVLGTEQLAAEGTCQRLSAEVGRLGEKPA